MIRQGWLHRAVPEGFSIVLLTIGLQSGCRTESAAVPATPPAMLAAASVHELPAAEQSQPGGVGAVARSASESPDRAAPTDTLPAPADNQVTHASGTPVAKTHPVSRAAFQSPASAPAIAPLPAGDPLEPEPLPEFTAGPSSATVAALQLDEVVDSVQAAYPMLLSVLLERQIASGKQLSAWGEFDLVAKAFGIAAPEGFYRTYRNGVSLNQPTFGGGYLYGGYKIGDGNFQPWFGERETNEGGEFSLGLGVPILKDRVIDKRRAALFQANLARQAVEPVVRANVLEFSRLAAQAYWSWVASGRTLAAQRELLQNAVLRVQQIQRRVEAGDLEQIARINNEQLIASRETKVIESDRKLQQSAIKLSLFLRDAAGEPVIPDDTRLPVDFPLLAAPDRAQREADIATAIAASPLLAELDLLAEQTRVELRAAENLLLPKLDGQILAAKDVGGQASSKGDKTPFELEAGLYGEVPLQRREARGKITAAQGKLAQIDAKRRFLVDKIRAAVQDAHSALEAAAGRIERAQVNLRLARETLALGQAQFEAGNVDLIDLNIYEKAVTDAQLLLISAQADFFFALADYQASLAQDPSIPSASEPFE